VAMTTADVRKARLFIPPSATGKVHVCERIELASSNYCEPMIWVR
jgi:hypothetical protein